MMASDNDLLIEINDAAIKSNDEWAAYAHKLNNDWARMAQDAMKDGFVGGFIVGILLCIFLLTLGACVS